MAGKICSPGISVSKKKKRNAYWQSLKKNNFSPPPLRQIVRKIRKNNKSLYLKDKEKAVFYRNTTKM